MNSTTPNENGRRLRVMLYAQHLSGVGHFVRSMEIARALSEKHDTLLIDGGRPIPRPWPQLVTRLELPRILRQDQGLAVLDNGRKLASVMEERSKLLVDTVKEFRPDVLSIEHYPFSKWELDGEVYGLIKAVRQINSAIKVVCSVRDIPRQTRHEDCSPEAYTQEVLRRLHAHFDAILVHGDAELTPLAAHFPDAGAIRLPVHYTGWVSEKPSPAPGTLEEISRVCVDRPYVLASIGGGRDGANLLKTCLDAWRGLQAKNALPGYVLVIFCGLTEPFREWKHEASEGVHLFPFSPGFLTWMQHAQLSVSCAGYNTSANVLETGCKAVLIPNPKMSDQAVRAELLVRMGAAQSITSSELTPGRLGEIMLAALSMPPASQRLDLNGAIRSLDIIERL